MLLLALDTSTRQSSIALCTEDQIYGEQTWSSYNNHSVELLTGIKRMLAEYGLSMAQVDAIAVATGPGSFNGVRVALTAAKALSFALSKPLIGVSTLECIAAQQQWNGPVCALLEAGRSELYAACYQFKEQIDESGEVTYQGSQFGDYLMVTPQQLAEYLQKQSDEWWGVPGERQVPPFLFCGEIKEASRQVLRAQLQERCLFADSVKSMRRASYLAALARHRLQAGQEDDAFTLEPLYLRRPSITTSARKQPLLGGKAQ